MKKHIIKDLAVELKNLRKSYKIPVKTEKRNIFTFIRDIFYRKYNDVEILHGINLEIKQGEFIGYVGPNGAGKSTTIKLMSGVLNPSSGLVRVLGFIPHKQRYRYVYNIGVVFGHKTLLWYDIPVMESFKLYRDVYELDKKEFEERLNYFIDKLKLKNLLHIPVRKLSLGERMRCEIAASFLHKPKIVFLDEPTIGLDVIAKEEIRDFLRLINKKEKTTIILTTHDMSDIEELCKRVVLIDKGNIIYDGSLDILKKKYVKHKNVEFEFSRVKKKRLFNLLLNDIEIAERTSRYIKFKVYLGRFDIPVVVDKIMDACDVIDLNVTEPKLEAVMREIYKEQDKLIGKQT